MGILDRCQSARAI